MVDVSFIVIAKNEEEHISRCLESILRQKNDGLNFEIIVVDNCSSDSTFSIAKKYPVKTFLFSGNGIASIRNYAVSLSRGRCLAFIDADCTIDESWMITAYTILNASESSLILGGNITAPKGATWVEKYWTDPVQIESDKSVSSIGAANMFVARSLFDDIGGFDSALLTGEDTDFCLRAKSMGVEIKKFKSLEFVHWGYPKNILGFIDRQIWQMAGQFNLKKLPNDRSMKIALVFLISLIFSFLFCFAFLEISILFLLFSLVITFAFSFKKSGFEFGRSFDFIYFLNLFIISFLYFLGRAIGITYAIFGKRYERKYK